MSNAVIWIVTESYFKEAERSLASARKYLPDARYLLLTPEKYEGGKFDQAIQLPERKHPYWFLDEVRYFSELWKLLPYKNIIFLDSDMLLIQDCSDLWQVLDKFDLALAHAPTRWTGKALSNLPVSFTEFCTGIVVFRNNDKVKWLFREWYELYAQYQDKYLENDQIPLRETLWWTELSIRIATLPPEMNTRFGLCGSAIKPVRILHGRYDGDMQDVIDMVDTSHGMVTWGFGQLHELNEQRKKDKDGRS